MKPGIQQQMSPGGAWPGPDPYTGRLGKTLVYSNPHNQRVAPAWHNGNVVHFLDLGEVIVDSGGNGLSPLYFVITGFDHEGTPVLVQGQYCIVTRLPGEPGYSQFCKVFFQHSQVRGGRESERLPRARIGHGPVRADPLGCSLLLFLEVVQWYSPRDI